MQLLMLKKFGIVLAKANVEVYWRNYFRFSTCRDGGIEAEMESKKMPKNNDTITDLKGIQDAMVGLLR